MASNYGMNFNGKRGFDFSSFSVLSGILSSEKIDVRIDHKAHTASFDTTNRVLSLPVLNFDGMSNHDYNKIYNGFIVHEVGHALYTKDMETINHALKTKGDIPFVIFNVVEDVRCNQLMRQRLPGARKAFNTYYSLLWNNGFYNLKDSPGTLGFIDRMNLLNKVPECQSFRLLKNDTEKTLFDRSLTVDTFDEVIDLCKDIHEYIKSVNEEQDQLDAMNGDTEIDKIINSSIEQGEENDNPRYVSRSKRKDSFDLKTIESSDLKTECIVNKTKNPLDTITKLSLNLKSVVSSMVNKFLHKQAAREYNKSMSYNTGKIDRKRLYKYQLDTNIFRSNELTEKGKNHGIILVVDVSSSMKPQKGPVIDQLHMFVDFCNRLSIPYTIYTYSDTRSYRNLTSSIVSKNESFALIGRLGISGNTDTIDATIRCKSSILHFNRRYPSIEKTTVVWFTDGQYVPYEFRTIRDPDTNEHLFVKKPEDTLFALIDLIKGISDTKFICSVLGKQDLLYSFVPSDEKSKFKNIPYQDHVVLKPYSGYDKVFHMTEKQFHTTEGKKYFMKMIAEEIAL